MSHHYDHEPNAPDYTKPENKIVGLQARLAAERQRREEAEALCAEMAEALRDARAAMHRRNQPSLANRAITRIDALLAKHAAGPQKT